MNRACSVALCLILLSAGTSLAQTPADTEFRRGLNFLHEFEYEDANDAFRRAQTLDPSFAMGYWGEAMTYHQTLWRHENVDRGRAALSRLGATPAARRARCRTDREADLVGAVELLFGDGDATARRRAYAAAMERVHSRFPDDPDIAALSALALLGTASRGLIGTVDAHEGHVEGLAGSETQARAAAILGEVLRSHPDHRGALHYLIHAYDDPQHAALALAAARHYSAIASASHARHMPSHVFLQLGLWHDAASSDRAAYDASADWVRSKGVGAALRNYHALAWLQYELLQLGRYREADQTLKELEPVVAAGGNTTLLSDLSSMRARYVVETRQWERMAHEQNFGNVNDLFAIGMSAVHVGNAGAAETVRTRLAARAQAPEEGDLRPAIAVMERELAGSIELAGRQRERGLSTLEAAARAELALPPPLGLPEPIKPAPELLGEALLEAGRPGDASHWFAETLKRNRNRSLSVAGLARAAAATADSAAASARYGELLANYDHADEELPELSEARGHQTQRQSDTSTRPRLLIATIVAACAAGVGAVAIRVRWHKAAAARAAKRGRRKGRKA